jgi:hypothetical protein
VFTHTGRSQKNSHDTSDELLKLLARGSCFSCKLIQILEGGTFGWNSPCRRILTKCSATIRRGSWSKYSC